MTYLIIERKTQKVISDHPSLNHALDETSKLRRQHRDDIWDIDDLLAYDPHKFIIRSFTSHMIKVYPKYMMTGKI